MSIYSGARAADVRALAGAIVLGSCAGLMLGAGYLVAGPAPSVSPGMGVVAQAAGAATNPSPATPAAQVSAASAPGAPVGGFAASLRQRFGLGAAARPFAFARVAAAPTDLHCLAETVYFEARGESQDGQKAVAQVVLNRVRHPAFPKTICAVVHQRTAAGCQFSFACSGREAAIDSLAWRRAETVASAALHGAVMAAVGDATHFQSAHAGSFAGLMKVAQVGAHAFYRFAGREGATAMFRQAPLPSTASHIELARLEPADSTATPHLVDVKVTMGAIPASATPAASKAAVVAVKLSASPAAAPVRTAVAPAAPLPLAATPPAAVAPAAKAQGPAAAKPAAMLALALAQS